MLHVALTHKIFSKAAVKKGSKGKEITEVVSLPLDVGVLVSGIFSRDTQPSFSPISGEYFSFFPYCLESNNSSYFVVKNQKSKKSMYHLSAFKIVAKTGECTAHISIVILHMYELKLNK